MKVLISSCTHWWNAEAAYAAVLAEALLGDGHQVMVWTQPGTANEAQLLKQGLPLVGGIPPAGNNPLRWSATLAGLARLQAREKFEIVDVFRSSEFPIHLLASRNRAGPRVVRTRGSARAVSGGWLNRKMYGQWCGGLIAPSEVVRSQLIGALGLSPGQVRTIYYPIDLPESGASAAGKNGRREFMKGLGLPAEGFLIGVVGRLFPEKGHARLLEAMKILVAKVPRSTLIIFAKDAPGEDPERLALEAQVKQAGLEGRVRFTGFLEEIRRAMGWMDLGVIPSLASEVNCRVAVEFFSVGTPVVAFPTGALPEVVEHGVSGWVTKGHDSAELADALETLARDKNQLAQLAKGAREQAEKRFSRSRFLAETLQVFQSVLQGHPRLPPAR